MEPQFVTPERLCWVLNISADTEQRWRAQKRISAFKIGKTVRYDPAAILAFIARNTTRARARAAGHNHSPEYTAEDWQRLERLMAEQIEARMSRKLLEAA